jgi:hypothetical protein
VYLRARLVRHRNSFGWKFRSYCDLLCHGHRRQLRLAISYWGTALSLRRALNLVGLALGSAFGFLIQAAGFGDADFIHRMLLLQNWYPYEVFGSAVLVGLIAFWLLERGRWITPLGGPLRLARTGIRQRHVYGGLLFGAAWAFSATCPVPALAMVMSGGLLGLPVVGGLFAGVLLGDRAAAGRVTLNRTKLRAAAPRPIATS